MHGGPFYSTSAAERKQPCCSVRFGRAEPEQPIGLLGRTEPSPSNRVMPPSKLNRACKPPSRARADPPLGLLGLITALVAIILSSLSSALVPLVFPVSPSLYAFEICFIILIVAL